MNIQIDPHTLEKAEERGASESEIKDVLETGELFEAKYGRSGKFKVFTFNQERLGKYYKEKRIEVIYIKEGDIIVTVTVYVFYGEWSTDK